MDYAAPRPSSQPLLRLLMTALLLCLCIVALYLTIDANVNREPVEGRAQLVSVERAAPLSAARSEQQART
jgi:hypothetical protein